MRSATVEVLIVGGGVIGCAAAAELADRGRQVLLLEHQQQVGHGCSFANAGTIVPSHALPLANPQALREGLASLCGPARGIRVQPRPSRALVYWLARFARAARPSVVASTLPDHAALIMRSVERLQSFSALAGEPGLYRQDGSLFAYQSAERLAAAGGDARALHAVGIGSAQLDREALAELEPAVAGATGAVFYPQDGYVDPRRLTDCFATAAREGGAVIETDCRVFALRPHRGAISALTQRGTISAHMAVIATGHRAAELARPLGLRLPILPAWGYSIDLANGPRPGLPIYLPEIGVMSAPTDAGVRLTGGFSLGSRAPELTEALLEEMVRDCARYMPSLSDAKIQRVWQGARPMTPDGLPLVGRSAASPNVVIAAGHGMLGMTLAAATARLVAEAVADGRQAAPTLSPDRFSRRCSPNGAMGR